MVKIFAAIRPKLTPDGSVVIELAAHTKSGRMSDYIYKTVLAIINDGWVLKYDSPWIKPDGPAIRDKRLWRQCSSRVLWFSQTTHPYMDPFANGAFSRRIGPSDYQKDTLKGRLTTGRSKSVDYFVSLNSEVVKQQHPTPFPISFPEQVIRTFSSPGDLVIDPMCGAGWALVAAKRLHREYWGCDIEERWTVLTKRNLREDIPPVRLLPNFQRKNAFALFLRHEKGVSLKSDYKIVKLIRLMTVDALDPVSAAQISLATFELFTDLSHPTVVAALKRLVGKGCIVRKPVRDRHNRQAWLVGLHPDFLEGSRRASG